MQLHIQTNYIDQRYSFLKMVEGERFYGYVEYRASRGRLKLK